MRMTSKASVLLSSASDIGEKLENVPVFLARRSGHAQLAGPVGRGVSGGPETGYLGSLSRRG